MWGLRYPTKRSASFMYCGLLVRVQGIARFADALAFRSGTLTPSPFPLLRSVEFHALHALGVRAVSPLGRRGVAHLLYQREAQCVYAQGWFLSNAGSLLTLQIYYSIGGAKSQGVLGRNVAQIICDFRLDFCAKRQ